jgi:uncharacterized protein YqhQ
MKYGDLVATQVFSYNFGDIKKLKYMMRILLTMILLPISLAITYSMTAIGTLVLAVGALLNYPILYLLGLCQYGSKEIRRKTKSNSRLDLS